MTRDRRLTFLAIAAVAVLFVLSNTVYQIDQREQALIVRFGDPVRVVERPGINLKTPFIENVVRFDKRNIAIEAEQEEIIAANQERLVVDAFVRYRITDPRQFFKTLRDERTADDRLTRLVNSSLRQELGRASAEEIISGGRAALTRRTRDDMIRRAAGSNLGVQIIDVRIKRADLPEANQKAVFERMQTARQQQAAELRAIGDQQRQEIIATATGEAETIRGEGDAKRAQLFASSFGRDPNFAAFYRSMQAYEASLGQGDTTLVLSPDSAFFKYFQRGPQAQ
ncbi:MULTISPECIES: protease modulator HflC [unclassified Caulobacter]|uniref:protease modulator HflC n=1 Tax=unclassified Caulobacter TaxID=2648921 RepID=UPI000D358864|nr:MULTISPECIES: protease modulator HflC [unclassified Caulobacter]PTS91207.1 protease modulator HflC [Caulobacter sp. HMWF009]PTT10215.1 protease modulator HflC [Caulobacter sp. HMWF025]